MVFLISNFSRLTIKLNKAISGFVGKCLVLLNNLSGICSLMTFLLIHCKFSPSFIFWSNSSRYFHFPWKHFRHSWFPILHVWRYKKETMHFISYFWTTSVYRLFPNEVVSSSAFPEVPIVHMGQFQFIFPVSIGTHTAESWTLLKCMPNLYASNNIMCFGHTFPISELFTSRAYLDMFWQMPLKIFLMILSLWPTQNEGLPHPSAVHLSLLKGLNFFYSHVFMVLFFSIPCLHMISQILNWCNLAGFIDFDGYTANLNLLPGSLLHLIGLIIFTIYFL